MEAFTEDYFLRGKEKGLSLYTDYRWLGQPTIDMAQKIVDHLDIRKFQTVLDFGCARGFLVRALREIGRCAHGIDVSSWAVKNADPNAYPYLQIGCSLNHMGECGEIGKYDWIIAKDVLEHVHDLHTTIDNLVDHARVGLFVVVPLSFTDGAPYVVPDYEEDVTHIHRFSLGTWINHLMRPGWKVEASYLVPGVKQNYAHYPMGNGFITLRRS